MAKVPDFNLKPLFESSGILTESAFNPYAVLARKYLRGTHFGI